MSESILPLSRIAGDARYEIDTDKARLDRALIHRFLVRSPWAKGIPREIMERAIDHSLAFGVYRDGRQVGFGRVVTDHATFAYIADVFLLPEERGKGLGRWLVETMLGHSELQGMRRWLLGTRSAHGLYRRCGFRDAPPPFSFLERLDEAVYQRGGIGRSRKPGDKSQLIPSPLGERVRVRGARRRESGESVALALSQACAASLVAPPHPDPLSGGERGKRYAITADSDASFRLADGEGAG